MKTCFKLSALASALALAMGPASAAEVYLAAKPFTKDLPLSGGTTETVPMWGYVSDTDGDDDGIGDCFQAADNAARGTCIDALPVPTLPGPRLIVDPADPTLTIHLSNGLPEHTSIVIPGQALPTSVGSGPTWDSGPPGSRSNAGQRVRSYGSEAAADGGTESYNWDLARHGTFIYHSGTWPQKQVYMGLYGAVTKDAVAAGTSAEAYPGVPYDNEVILFYSDVDPAHNAAVDANDTSYTPLHYHAKWFLVNGEPYVDGVTADIPAGNTAGGTGNNTLVRLLSAASETHVPTLQGLYMSIHAEDGFRYSYQNGDAVGDFAPREQYSAMLPPLKTKDAIVVADAEGTYAVYDGNGYMTNPSDPDNFDQGDELGGMLRFLAVGADGPLFFSTAGNASVPGVVTPNNNADIYAYDGSAYSRDLAFVATMGFNGNVDALDIVDGDTFYLSFANTTRTVPGVGQVQDEDVLLYDAGTWSLYFDGAVCGLDQNGGQDIDAISIDSGTLYFSTLGGGDNNPVGGATAPYDDADVYTWSGGTTGTANCARALDANVDAALPGNADIDGLTVRGGIYYLSFNRNGGVSVPTLDTVEDEAVVSFDGTNWSMYFSGPGLDVVNGQDVDGFDLP